VVDLDAELHDQPGTTGKAASQALVDYFNPDSRKRRRPSRVTI
jgi:hypothetical protein